MSKNIYFNKNMNKNNKTILMKSTFCKCSHQKKDHDSKNNGHCSAMLGFEYCKCKKFEKDVLVVDIKDVCLCQHLKSEHEIKCLSKGCSCLKFKANIFF